jgi:hypothetical protein
VLVVVAAAVAAAVVELERECLPLLLTPQATGKREAVAEEEEL